MEPESFRSDAELPSKPLVEAILELRWELQTVQPDLQVDPGFRILYGQFFGKVKGDFPLTVDLPLSTVPQDMTPHTVRHQLRKGTDLWPVLQLGPGILTVNEAKPGYSWESFSAVAVQALEALYECYPSDVVGSSLKPVDVHLRYINALFHDTPPVVFLKERLHTQIVPDPTLFEKVGESPEASDVTLRLSYPLAKLPGVAAFQFVTSKRNNEDTLLWEIRIRVSGADTPQKKDDVLSWLNRAHDIADDWFFRLPRGKLLESFEEEPK